MVPLLRGGAPIFEEALLPYALRGVSGGLFGACPRFYNDLPNLLFELSSQAHLVEASSSLCGSNLVQHRQRLSQATVLG